MTKSNKVKRWARFGYLGTCRFPQAALRSMYEDTELSPRNRELASQIAADLTSLSAGISHDLKRLDEEQKKK